MLSEAMGKGVARFFRALGKEAARAYGEISEGAGGDEWLRAWCGNNGLKRSEEEKLADLIMDTMAPSKFDLDYSPHYLRTATTTYKDIGTILGIGIEMTDEAELRILQVGGTRKGLLDIPGDTKKALFTTLSTAREEGWGPPKIARAIRDSVAGGRFRKASTRAKLIARTETKYAQNISSVEAYGAAEVDKLEVIDGQLPDSDEICIRRDGTIVTMAQAEAIMQDEHPNGTLSFAPVVGS